MSGLRWRFSKRERAYVIGSAMRSIRMGCMHHRFTTNRWHRGLRRVKLLHAGATKQYVPLRAREFHRTFRASWLARSSVVVVKSGQPQAKWQNNLGHHAVLQNALLMVLIIGEMRMISPSLQEAAVAAQAAVRATVHSCSSSTQPCLQTWRSSTRWTS